MTGPYPDIEWQHRGGIVMPAKVLRIVDGDTFHPLIYRGLGETLRPRKGLRITGSGNVKWDAPDREDLYSRAAATRRLMFLLPLGSEVLIAAYGYDDLSRVLAAVILPDGHDLAVRMTQLGHRKGLAWFGPMPTSADSPMERPA